MAGEQSSNTSNSNGSNDDKGIEKIGDYSVTQLLGRARAIVKERTKDWEIIWQRVAVLRPVLICDFDS